MWEQFLSFTQMATIFDMVVTFSTFQNLHITTSVQGLGSNSVYPLQFQTQMFVLCLFWFTNEPRQGSSFQTFEAISKFGMPHQKDLNGQTQQVGYDIKGEYTTTKKSQ